MRAERVAQIFEKIIKDSFENEYDQKELIQKIRLIGHGSIHDKYGYRKKDKLDTADSTWVVYEKLDKSRDSVIAEYKKTDEKMISPERRAKDETWRKLRRVEIILVIKGIPEV